MSPYSRALDSLRREIRVLVLQPTSAGETIQCSTETVSLLDQPEYEALSYVWGDASRRRSIIFDGESFSVTENLAIALSYIRLPDMTRRVWVDALCINQSDIEERNAQVEFMGEIYANANPVLIWLGEAGDGSDEALALLSTITSEAGFTEDTSQQLFAFFMELVEREWFSRLWTIQELVLAKQDPLVGCGFVWSTWSILFGAWQKIAMREFEKMGMILSKVQSEVGSDEDFTASVRTSAIKIDLLNNLRNVVGRQGGMELRDILLNTHSSQSTERRDRIYGLLGMMRREDRVDFVVDYSRNLGAIFAEAVAHISKKYNAPFLLSGMELVGNSPDASFPSWVPNFGSRSLLSPTLYHPPGIGASGAGSDCVNGIVAKDLKIFHVRGLHIDVVIEKLVFGEKDGCLTQLSQVEALVCKARQLASLNLDNRPYLAKLKEKEPVWRTLIANKKYSGAEREVAPESYAGMYKNILSNGDTLENVGPSGDDSDRDYRLRLLNHLPSSCFFITSTGFYGIGQDVMEVGDHLAIWFGAPVPFIMRPVLQTSVEHGTPVNTVRGVAYVSGIMDGEMVDEIYCEDLEDDIEFTIV